MKMKMAPTLIALAIAAIMYRTLSGKRINNTV
ncbi:hypothetical protein WP2W18C05_12070 [Aeromonas sp. WP2-W18-CRE-05]|nr:hypothetical protein WP2W18C05_12070 [Aeromonas sp. WP2-W18-CRE-05]